MKIQLHRMGVLFVVLLLAACGSQDEVVPVTSGGVVVGTAVPQTKRPDVQKNRLVNVLHHSAERALYCCRLD